MKSIYSVRARKFAIFIAAVAGATLLLRVVLRLEASGGLLGAVSYLSQFFTILTNFLIFLSMTWIGSGRLISPKIMRALTVAILCVGIVYHAVLSHLLDLSGLALLADHGVHTVVPLLTCAWWLFFVQKPKLNWFDPMIWTLWPLVYCAYILIRAASSGFYPYPFLNVAELGADGVAISVVILIGVFVAVGLTLRAIETLFGVTPTPGDLA